MSPGLVPLTPLSSPGLCAIAYTDRATRYAAASLYPTAVSGILDPRFRGDDSDSGDDSEICLSRSDANELK
jgi:hypothetical protein